MMINNDLSQYFNFSYNSTDNNNNYFSSHTLSKEETKTRKYFS